MPPGSGSRPGAGAAPQHRGGALRPAERVALTGSAATGAASVLPGRMPGGGPGRGASRSDRRGTGRERGSRPVSLPSRGSAGGGQLDPGGVQQGSGDHHGCGGHDHDGARQHDPGCHGTRGPLSRRPDESADEAGLGSDGPGVAALVFSAAAPGSSCPGSAGLTWVGSGMLLSLSSASCIPGTGLRRCGGNLIGIRWVLARCEFPRLNNSKAGQQCPQRIPGSQQTRCGVSSRFDVPFRGRCRDGRESGNGPCKQECCLLGQRSRVTHSEAIPGG
jgi:hypothetical protein